MFEDDIFRIEVPVPDHGEEKPIKADKLNAARENERKILAYLETNPDITNAEARVILNLAESTVKHLLAEMTKKGLVTAVGERRARKYVLEKKENS